MITASKTLDYQQFRRARVLDDLRRLGVSNYGLAHMEARYLPEVLHQDEPICGVVYGHTGDGFGMLVATDRRVIYLNVRPLFVAKDEITYDVISGVSFGHSGFGSSVTLHTKVKDYAIRTYNRHCAEQFIAYIETRCLEHRIGDMR